jgi:hypothetical protein
MGLPTFKAAGATPHAQRTVHAALHKIKTITANLGSVAEGQIDGGHLNEHCHPIMAQ